MAVPDDVQETLSLLQVRPGRPPRAGSGKRSTNPNLPSAVEPGDTGWSTVGDHGVPAQALAELASALGLSGPRELASELGLAERTVQRRLSNRQSLSPEESEKSIRVARALVKARHVLEDKDAGARWLQTPSKALGGRTPLSLLGSGDGFTAVMDELGRIDHGVYS